MATRAESFIQGEMRKYIVSDIERLAALHPEGPEGLGACTIPEAMLLFATTDLFGYLVRADCKRPKLDDTKGNLRAIFAHPLAGFSPEYLAGVDILTDLFRHGLMHQIFPKAAGIRKAGAGAPLFERFNNLDHLNIDKYAANVIKMIESFSDSLPLPQWQSLGLQMSERLDRISESDFREMTAKKAAEQHRGR